MPRPFDIFAALAHEGRHARDPASGTAHDAKGIKSNLLGSGFGRRYYESRRHKNSPCDVSEQNCSHNRRQRASFFNERFPATREKNSFFGETKLRSKRGGGF